MLVKLFPEIQTAVYQTYKMLVCMYNVHVQEHVLHISRLTFHLQISNCYTCTCNIKIIMYSNLNRLLMILFSRAG